MKKDNNIKETGSKAIKKNTAEALKAVSPIGPTSWIASATNFLKEVRVEFDKVHWPTRKEAMALSGAVFFITAFFTFYLGLVDGLLSRIVTFLMG